VCCSVLQCDAVHSIRCGSFSVLHTRFGSATPHFDQCVAALFKTLCFVAVYCTLDSAEQRRILTRVLQRYAVHYSLLQCVAVSYSTLQCVPVCCTPGSAAHFDYCVAAS